MNKIKEICDKYKLSHRQLAILMGYHRDTVQKINTGKRPMTQRFSNILTSVETALKNEDLKLVSWCG